MAASIRHKFRDFLSIPVSQLTKNFYSGVREIGISFGTGGNNYVEGKNGFFITAFLAEEIAPYHAGGRTLDDAIKILNDRSEKYIKEM